MSSTLSICTQPFQVLIDPSSTHSFVSLRFVNRFPKRAEPLNHIMHISTPSGELLMGTLVYKSFPIDVSSHKLFIDLIVLYIRYFEVILGMDWLTSYHAKVDYFEKRVTLQIPN